MNNILQCMNMKQSKLKNKKNMKNLEKILMLMAFVGAASSFCVSLYTHTSWSWQLVTIVWIVVAYMKLKLSERQERIIEKLTK